MSSLMRRASFLVCPWLLMGSLPPVLSMRMSAQSMPVSMRTEATRLRWMLISFTVNQERLRRITA